ncbi:MAG: VWA domain-containing protein, partial [Myxococcaceae bacterium]|nr:VWA domain-containing protein [Myxococcaceae bacterium]
MWRGLLVGVLAAACGRTVVYDPPEAPPKMIEPVVPVVDAGMPKPCSTGPVALLHAIPTLYFVVDRSGSMAFDLNGNQVPNLEGPSRWEILTAVMTDVLPAHEQQLAMGLIFFPSDAQCGTTATPAISPRLGNAQALRTQFLSRRPGGGTPIAAGMVGVRGPAMAARAKSLVLITDGEPNCNADLDPATCVCTQAMTGNPPACPTPDVCLDDTRTVTTLQTLTASGVVTHVVGFA